MKDAETQLSLERINDRNLWAVGWSLCVIVTLYVVALIALDWHLRGLAGKLTAGSLLVFLIVWPTILLIGLKRRQRMLGGALFFGAYMLLMLAVQAFGPLARAR